MDQIPSPLPSPAVYDQLAPPKLTLASFYAHHPAAHHGHHHPHHPHQGGFLHPALSQYAQHHPLYDPFRPRSGSLLSLGSTGSSHRPERSPSRESTSSHDSVSPPTPLGFIPDSPSPSPPNEASKLFGLLKGTVSSPYNSYFSGKPTGRSGSISGSGEAVVSRAEIVQRFESMRRPSLDMTIARKESRYSGGEPLKRPPPALIPAPELLRRAFTLSDPPLKRHISSQDGPMDLSCKPKRPRMDSVSSVASLPARRFPPPTETVTRSSLQAMSRSATNSPAAPSPSTSTTDVHCPPPPILEPISPPSRAPSRDSVASTDESSILRSILCGGLSSSGHSSSESCSYPSRPASVKSDASGLLCPTSPAALSEPASPTNSSILSRLMAGSPCNMEANQRVGIAKKTLFPVRARVTYWLAKTVNYAKSLPEFSSLCSEDQTILITNAWAKILVLYMSENNFEFAVSPVLVDAEGEEPVELGGNPEVPTMKSVEHVQGFIHKCHSMSLDATEFKHVKSAVLFQTGNTGLKEKNLVEEANGKARESLQKHIQATRPSDKMRYSSLLLRLHALSGINKNMIQNLFCKHITNKVTMDAYLNDLLFEQAPESK